MRLPARSLLWRFRSQRITMPMTVQNERDNVYRLEVRGLMRREDMERCEKTLIDEVSRVGPVRLLFLLKEFEGWDPRDDWRDLTYYVKHGSAIERIAIVGDEKWRSEALMFAGADLRSAAVEFFPEEHAAAARAWLAG